MSLQSGQFTERIIRYLESTGKQVDEKLLDEASSRVRHAFKRQLMEDREVGGKLRLSAAGHCVRKQYYGLKGYTPEPLSGRTINTFLMGDICETSLSVVARLAGWKMLGKEDGIESEVSIPIVRVDDNGNEHIVDEVKGHIDELLQTDDGEMILVEMKSMSEIGFMMFEKGQFDDTWGYKSQSSAYATALGIKRYMIVAFSKNTGHLADRIYDADPVLVEKAKERWGILRVAVNPPNREYDFVDELVYNRKTKQKEPTGRRILPVVCSYCGFKTECWGDQVKVEMKGDKPIFVMKGMEEQV